MSSTINCIGCGKVGKTLLKLMRDQHLVDILGIVNRDEKSAQEAIQFIGQGTAYKTFKELPAADITLIASSDSAIQSICEAMVDQKILKPQSIVLHCSGALSSQVLVSAKKLNCHIASVHPVRSFADPISIIQNFKGTFCGYEGDTRIAKQIKQLFEAIGGVIFDIDAEYKSQYHAATVMANNYVTTLHYHAMKTMRATGVEEELAKKLISQLMLGALENLENNTHSKALTGPLQRGDIHVLQQHMAALNTDELTAHLYALLGEATLPLTEHAETQLKAIRKIMKKVPTNLA